MSWSSESQAATGGASRRFPMSRPLLPGPLDAGHQCFYLDLSLASNASEAPMQALRLSTLPLLHEPTQRINLRTDMALASYRKDLRIQGDNYGVALRKASMRTSSLRLSSASLHQRAYHQEPYPASFNFSASPSSSPTELLLPPFFDAPASPKLKHALVPIPAVIPESPSFWLVMYFCFNLGLTLYNKGVLVSFPFPYTLSALHALFGTIGGTLLAHRGCFAPSRLDLGGIMTLMAFSILYAINIVVSNISLQLVTVPFHQVVRAATPIFTILFSGLLFGTQSSHSKKISLLPVVAGVGLATFGDYYFSYTGFFLTLLGTILAALKTIFTNVLQTPTELPSPRSRLYFSNPFDLLFFLSPLALVHCVLLAHFTGELNRVRDFSLHEMSSLKLIALLLNGCIAFGLNVVSFSANRRVGALGMTVAANVKQVLTIVFAVVIFKITITSLNAVGIVLTLVGGAWYAWIELLEKQRGV
ncbi:TPT domain-containing protein [Mycena sanguinolenta]|uniref:TPT domain-containing protein n=1 Tax=Mycena sanguinolenta TaxID=230812 RepID=A0A8H6YXP8_9AGAR|nr:TPT domain-containing protein [Mycena sanguinolenta]